MSQIVKITLETFKDGFFDSSEDLFSIELKEFVKIIEDSWLGFPSKEQLKKRRDLCAKLYGKLQ